MIQTWGHSGVRHHPALLENTLPALREGLTEGDGVETDVECSFDGVPYLIHNSFVRFLPYIRSWVSYRFPRNLDRDARKMAGNVLFEDLPSARIDGLWLKDFSGIPRLSDLFALVAELPDGKDKTINLELKSQYCARGVINAIAAAEEKGQIRHGQVIVSSFDHGAVADVSQRDPALRTGLIFWQDSMRSCRLYPWDKGNKVRAKPVSLKNLEDPVVRRIMPDHFVLPAGALTKIYAEAVSRDLYPDSSFIVWTPGREPLPEKNKALHRVLDDPAIRRCIHAVITNHPGRMKEFLRPL